MPLTSRVVARNVVLAGSLREKIDERIAKLDGFFGGIRSCLVTVEGPGSHHRQGTHSVHVTLAVPRRTLVINHQSDLSPEIAVREAFDAADRRLEDHARRARGNVKRPSGGRRGREATPE